MPSICECYPFWSSRTVKNCWKHSDLAVAYITCPKICGFLGIRQLYQKFHNVISASVWCFVPFSETWIMVLILQIGQSNFRVSIIMNNSVLAVDTVTSEPFFKSHSTHNIIIGHRIKTVESTLDSLLGPNTGLIIGCNSCSWVALPVQNILIFETPRLENKWIYIFRFSELILHGFLIKEEALW